MKQIQKLMARNRETGETSELPLFPDQGFDLYLQDGEGTVLTVGQDRATGEVQISEGYEHEECPLLQSVTDPELGSYWQFKYLTERDDERE